MSAWSFAWQFGNAHHIHNEKSSVGAILDECRRLNRWKYMTREAEVEMEKRKRREKAPPK